MGSGLLFSVEASEDEAFFVISQNNSLYTAPLINEKISPLVKNKLFKIIIIFILCP